MLFNASIWPRVVRDTLQAGGGDDVVIGTEYEPEKAQGLRENRFEGGGTERSTTCGMMICGDAQADRRAKWISCAGRHLIAMARPALELVASHPRTGAIVICDNTEQHRSGLRGLFRPFSSMIRPMIPDHDAALDGWARLMVR